MNRKPRLHDVRRLPHLKATVYGFLPFGRGNCMQRSVAMVMDIPTAKLVIGTLFSDHRFWHAWVEDRGMFYDPSRFEEDHGLLPYEVGRYIEDNSVGDLRSVDRKWVMDFAKEGALSRWMLRSDNTYHTLGNVMGHVLLDRLRVPYRVDDDGFLLPR